MEQPTDAPFPYDEVEVAFSDQHLGAGKTLPVRRRSWRYQYERLWLRLRGKKVGPHEVIEVPNPLEQFHGDDVVPALIRKLVAQYGRARILRLRLLGDNFDPLTMTWRGRADDPDFEVVGAYKMRQIIRGHRPYFDALAEFVRLPNARLDIFVGNHDQFLDWPKVQALIVRRLCGNDADLRSRVRLIDRTKRYEDLHRGVHWYHGMNAEPHNTIHPDTSIIAERFGRKLKRPVLNKPLGSDMTVRLVNRMKLFNEHFGMLRKESDNWSYTALFAWFGAVWAGISLCWYLFSQQVMILWDVRDHNGLFGLARFMFGKLGETLRVVFSTIKDNPVDADAKKFLRDRGGTIRVAVRGHSHLPVRHTDTHGTYLNTGSHAKMVKYVYPKLELRWGRLRTVELGWRALRHFFVTGRISFARQLAKFVGFLSVVVPLFVFLFTNYKAGEKLLSFEANELKWPVAIFAVLALVGGLVRIFAVRPHTEDDTHYTFVLVRHGIDGNLSGDVKQYFPEEDAIRDYV